MSKYEILKEVRAFSGDADEAYHLIYKLKEALLKIKTKKDNELDDTSCADKMTWDF